MKTSLAAINKRLAIRNLTDFAMSLPQGPFTAKDVRRAVREVLILKTLGLIEGHREPHAKIMVWETTKRHDEWKAYHCVKYHTPRRVLDYILIEGGTPNSNFLVDAYDMIMGNPMEAFK